MKMVKQIGILFMLGLLVAPALCVSAYADDFDVVESDYYVLDGLDGMNGQCTDYGSLGESSGEIGVSHYVSIDKTKKMAGSIQASFDDGRPGSSGSDCVRKQQVYTLVDRGVNIPGQANTFFSLKLDGDPCPHEQCQWSTMYAGPNVSKNNDLSGYSEQMKYETGTKFPDFIGGVVRHSTTTPMVNNKSTSRYYVLVNPNNSDLRDLITIYQYVYKPDGVPYFDVTWHISSNRYTYEDVKFWHAIDTYTSGNDFGYGYVCDVTKIAGGTGGSAFFQGAIALHPSAKQNEGWWAKNFQDIRLDDLPTYSSEPLGPTSSAPLTALEDNGIAHEWDGLTVDPEGTYVSMRWTFDDPIRKSTYGTTRSLFAVSSDDESYKKDDGTMVDVDPMIFDVIYQPKDWRGAVSTMRNPKVCSPGDDSKCQQKYPDEKCMPVKGCTGDACPHFCAYGYCGDDHSCAGASHYCIFDYCVVGRKWATEDNIYLKTSGGAAARNIFTIKKTTGQKLELANIASDSDFIDQAGVADQDEAQNLIDWMYGKLNNYTEKSVSEVSRKVIEENDSHDYDMHSVNLLRARYKGDASDPDEWILHDISHAEPVYVGAASPNSWSEKPGGALYGEYINSEIYQKRLPVLLVAANDGMLHAFDATTGDELWAFLPWDIIPKMKELASPIYDNLRTPTMDLKPAVYDVCQPPCTDVAHWTTRLLVGSREGGETYWAFDIKPPSKHMSMGDIDFKWYFEDDDLGLTYSYPIVGRFKSDNNSPDPGSQWLVFFGSGYAKHSAGQMTKKGFFYALDMFCNPSGGNKLNQCGLSGGAFNPDNQKIEIKNGSVAGVAKAFDNNVLSDPIVVDRLGSDGSYGTDGYEDTVYIGDRVGHMLRFYDNPASPGIDINGAVLFNTYRSSEDPNVLEQYKYYVENPRLAGLGDDTQEYSFYKYPRPITTRPQVWRPQATNDMMVFFGSGKYDSFYDSFDDFTRNLDGGVTAIDRQNAFGIKDTGGYVTWAELLHHTVEPVSGNLRKINEDSSLGSFNGWRIEFDDGGFDRGERVITDMQVLQQENRQTNEKDWVVFFTTFTPNMQATCDLRDIEGAGAGYLMTVRAVDGKNPNFAIQDIDGDSLLNANDTFGSGGQGFAGQKFSGTILSRVVVDSASQAAYVKTGPDSPVLRIQIMGQPTFGGQNTLFYRIK